MQKPGGPEPRLVAAYKAILKEYIDRRPSGMRARIAATLGKNKSFVSQLTNPVYPMPIPARHLPAIVDICHFSAEERRTLLKAYAAAHPGKQTDEGAARAGAPPRRKPLTVEIAVIDDPRKQHALEALVREFAERVSDIIDDR